MGSAEESGWIVASRSKEGRYERVAFIELMWAE
jgi:hypothetical protein